MDVFCFFFVFEILSANDDLPPILVSCKETAVNFRETKNWIYGRKKRKGFPLPRILGFFRVKAKEKDSWWIWTTPGLWSLAAVNLTGKKNDWVFTLWNVTWPVRIRINCIFPFRSFFFFFFISSSFSLFRFWISHAVPKTPWKIRKKNFFFHSNLPHSLPPLPPRPSIPNSLIPINRLSKLNNFNVHYLSRFLLHFSGDL